MFYFIYISIPLTLAVGIFVVVKIFKHLRAKSSQEIILISFCKIQNRSTQWIRDPALAQRVLLHSDSKGNCIEQLISYRAWLPVLSLESVDGEQWRRMKKSFLLLHTHLPPKEKLSEITNQIVQVYLDTGKDIDSPAIAHIALEAMTKWLFDEDFKPEWEFLSAAILEWRKELAIKGKGDMRLKLRAIEWIKDMIAVSKYYPIFEEKWNDPEHYSLLLQPFFISPVINITDIAVTIGSTSYSERLKALGHPISESSRAALNDHIIYAINFSHPFPLLERWVPDELYNSSGQVLVEPNTQVFIPLDEMGHTAEFGKSQWMAFGGGKRACAGRDIAMSICVPLFSKVVLRPEFKPYQNHMYSGRVNDLKETWSQSLFQVKTLVSILVRLLKKKFMGELKK